MAVRSNAKIANEAWEALFRAQATIARELTSGDLWADLIPREYGVLYALSKARDGLRITDLGEDVAAHAAGDVATRRAPRGTRGLVRRVEDPGDARVCRIRLTDAGRRSSAVSGWHTRGTSPGR